MIDLIMLEGAKSMGAGAATIASAGAAIGIGNVFSSLIHSVARNPSLAKQLFGYAILGFALTEAIALFALMMAFLISFVFRFFFKYSLEASKDKVVEAKGDNEVLKNGGKEEWVCGLFSLDFVGCEDNINQRIFAAVPNGPALLASKLLFFGWLLPASILYLELRLLVYQRYSSFRRLTT